MARHLARSTRRLQRRLKEHQVGFALLSVVEATLRERTSGSGNGALLSRLPKWVKAAKGREANGRALERLRERPLEA